MGITHPFTNELRTKCYDMAWYSQSEATLCEMYQIVLKDTGCSGTPGLSSEISASQIAVAPPWNRPWNTPNALSPFAFRVPHKPMT